MAFRTIFKRDGQPYAVSTIIRESSSLELYGELYAETLVWSLNSSGGLADIVAHDEHLESYALDGHIDCVRRFYNTGALEEDNGN